MRLLTIALAVLLFGGCDRKAKPEGPIRYDGSSTVYPIVRELGDRFAAPSSASFLVGASGTTAGIRKLCRGELDIAGASRPIRSEELQACASSKVEVIEVPIAFDGIAVVVNAENDWVDELTVDELATIWSAESEGEVDSWDDVRGGFPKRPLNLYGPGLDSGTLDYFSIAVLGPDGSPRNDYDSSESDDFIVEAVSEDVDGLGFFSMAYATTPGEEVRVVPIDDGDDSNGAGGVKPTPKTIAMQKYQPLTRPVFVYVSKASAERDEVSAFVNFLLDGVPAIAEEAGFAPLPPRAYDLGKERFRARRTGSAFAGGAKVDMRIEELLKPVKK